MCRRTGGHTGERQGRGWTLVSEGRADGLKGQLQGPPQKTSKDAGGTGEARSRGQLGCALL